jgi:hypothetical protein
MFVSHALFRLAYLVPLTMLAACIGMRTPLDDASTTSGDGSRLAKAACGSTITIDTTPAQPDVLILLDRSASMDWSLSVDAYCAPRETSCSSRSAAVMSALDAVVNDNPKINWGLELFPTPNASTCSVASTPQVAISANSASAIKSQLAASTTSFSTPTTSVLTAATAYLKKIDDGRSKAILLATDGLPNCGGGQDWTTDDLAGATRAATAAKNAGFPVYVVGMGPGVSNLDSLAHAGGTGSYYPATSTTTLDAALQSIAKVVFLTCTFKVNAIPPDKDLATLYVDKNLVPKDGSNGWMFDPADATYSSIVLTGTYCQAMLSGATSQVQIVFGCPEASSPDAMP